MPLDFKRLLITRFLFSFASQVQGVILGWQMYMLTRNPLCLGMVGLTEAIPALGLAPFAGYLVDKRNPIVIYRRMLGGSLLSALVMLISQTEMIPFDVNLRVAGLFIASFLTGAARAFAGPSIYALVPRMIERDNLARASAWTATVMQIARVSGPALGGLAIASAGMSGSTALVTIVLLLSLTGSLVWDFNVAHAYDATKPVSADRDLLAGIRFVWRNQMLFSALALDMVSVLFGGVTALLPIYAAEILMTDATGLGLLRAAPAIGAAVVSFSLTSFDLRQRAGPLLFSAVSGFGVCILVFALSRNYTLSLIALTLSGAFDSVGVVIRMSTIQLLSPDSMRGQISAVNSIFVGSSNEIGEFESGVMAKLIGTVPAAVFGGVMCLGTVIAVSYLSPGLRRLNLRLLENPNEIDPAAVIE